MSLSTLGLDRRRCNNANFLQNRYPDGTTERNIKQATNSIFRARTRLLDGRGNVPICQHGPSLERLGDIAHNCRSTSLCRQQNDGLSRFWKPGERLNSQAFPLAPTHERYCPPRAVSTLTK